MTQEKFRPETPEYNRELIESLRNRVTQLEHEINSIRAVIINELIKKIDRIEIIISQN